MSKREAKTYTKVRKKVESILEKKEKLSSEKKNVKFEKSDLIFVIVYFLIYLLLLTTFLIITPVNLDATYEEIILWDEFFWILLYAIGAPIIYLLIRLRYQKKKKNF